MTTPPRSRSGLAKLRGEEPAAAPAATDEATATAPPAGTELPVQPGGEPDARTPADPSPAGTSVETAPDARGHEWDVEHEVPDEPDVVSETSGATTEAPRPGKTSLSRRLIALLAALVLAVAVMAYFAFGRWNNQLVRPSSAAGGSTAASSSGSQANADARLAALRAARQFTVSFFTYDYRSIDAYFRRVEAASTGAFRSDFVSKEKTLKTVVNSLKTVATGQVPDAGAGIFALADDKAVALVAANFNASNAVTKKGQRLYRVKISLQLVKGNWLVTDFQQVV